MNSELAFKIAVEERDHVALRNSLHSDVIFYSPLVDAPFVGADLVANILRIPAQVFAFSEAFRYTKVISDGNDHALFFQADLDGDRLEGVDQLVTDDDGLVTHLNIMMRPLSQIQRFRERADEILRALRSNAAE